MLFTVDIDEEWLDALDSLIQTTLGNAKAGIIGRSRISPEEVLTVSIFFQFRLQRLKDKGVVRFPYDPQPQELDDYWDEDGEFPASCLDDKIEENLVSRCFSCGVEAWEWETICFECGEPIGGHWLPFRKAEGR